MEDKDMQEEKSETKANEKEEMQKDERRKLSCDLMKKIYPSAFRNWPILSLLKLDFTMQIRMVMVYGDWGNRALIVTKDKNVYTINYNKADHLKTADTHTGLNPKKMKILCGKNIKTFACNSYFVLALTEEGEVYSWRFNQKSILGSPYLSKMAFKPTQVLYLHNIVDIACGNFHSLALTHDGQVYAWGDNNCGQISVEVRQIDVTSRNRGINFISELRLIDKLKEKKVICIACGSEFNIVVTDEGKLYGWGDNTSGQIDYQHIVKQSACTKYYSSPVEINVNNKMIVKVACGFEHTLALTDEGKIYAWGKNDKGQVGVNNNLESSVPTMVDMPELIKDIAANDNMSVAVGSNKTVYVWGDCFGQNITTPFLTGFSSIYDAFVYSTMRVMHKPLAVSNSDVEEVLNIFESLGLDIPGMEFDDPSTSDFIIQVEEQRIHVHKAILQIRCQYFKNMFQHDWTENNESVLDSVYDILDKYSYIVCKAFFKYFYTDTIELSSENALELMMLANEYGETNLKRKCSQIVKQTITTSNVAFFYSKTIEYNIKELEEFCFQFALGHMKDVILSKEYIQLDISMRNNFIQRAAKENAFRT